MEYKKQAIVWIITIAIAIATLTSANNRISSNNSYENDVKEDSIIEIAEETNTKEALASTLNVEKNVSETAFGENLSWDTYGPDNTIIKEATTNVVYDTPEVIANVTGLNAVEENTNVTVSVATEVSYVDEINKTITLDDGTTISYMYADISQITAYCPCLEICCNHGNPEWYGYACSGRYLLEEEDPKVLAADLSRYPIGTQIFVPGYGLATVEDIGGKIDDRDLDVYFHDHTAAENWGVKYNQLIYIISFGEWN